MLLADPADSRLNMAIIKLALFDFTLICSFHASFKDRKLLVLASGWAPWCRVLRGFACEVDQSFGSTVCYRVKRTNQIYVEILTGKL